MVEQDGVGSWDEVALALMRERAIKVKEKGGAFFFFFLINTKCSYKRM
jgi:hypothetical protein